MIALSLLSANAVFKRNDKSYANVWKVYLWTLTKFTWKFGCLVFCFRSLLSLIILLHINIKVIGWDQKVCALIECLDLSFVREKTSGQMSICLKSPLIRSPCHQNGLWSDYCALKSASDQTKLDQNSLCLDHTRLKITIDWSIFESLCRPSWTRIFFSQTIYFELIMGVRSKLFRSEVSFV